MDNIRFLNNEINNQQDTITELLHILNRIMVMFPDMCADADMLDDPSVLALITQAREVITEAESHA